MPTLFQHRRLYSLIVSLAILLNLCAPALSQTVASADAVLALEICSAAAGAEARPGAGKHAPGGLPAHGFKHCALCAAHAGDDAPPPPAAGLLSVLDGHDAYPSPRAAAPPRPVSWGHAQPRGPPAVA